MFKDCYDERHFTHGAKWNESRCRLRYNFEEINVQNSIEGWAAAATVAAAAISAGATAYSSSQSAGAQEDMAKALGKKPKIVPVNFEDPSTAYNEYYSEVGSQYPQLEKQAQTFNTADNADYRAMLAGVSPSLMPAIRTQGTQAASLLKGQIPQDVQDEIRRTTAQQTLTGGYGAGSGASRALSARDLGTTSLGLINQGSTLLGSNLANAKAVNPYDFTGDSLLLTPQQLLSRDDSNAAYANGVANANNNIQYQNSLYNTAAGSYNPAGAGIISGVGALAGSATGRSAIGTVGSAVGNYFSNPNGGSYTNPNAGAYDQASAYATQNGVYNPYADTNNYDESGAFLGNPNSYGGG